MRAGRPPGPSGRRRHLRLVSGADRTPAAVTEAAPVVDGDPLEEARSVCLRLLAGRPRTWAELDRALRQHGVSPQVAAEVLGRLGEVGLVDDAEFAAAWVRSGQGGRRLGRRALSDELRRRGVGADTVQEALAGLSAEDELAVARQLVERRLPAMAGLEPRVRDRRLIGMLARRGYTPCLALTVLRQVLEAQGGQPPADDTAFDTDGCDA